MNPLKISISGINQDKITTEEDVIFKSRLFTLLNKSFPKSNLNIENAEVHYTEANIASNNFTSSIDSPIGNKELTKKAKSFVSQKPLYNFDRLIVSSEVRDDILLSLKVIEHEPEMPTIFQGANKPEETQNLFEVKTKEDAPRAPMEESRHDPYREPII